MIPRWLSVIPVLFCSVGLISAASCTMTPYEASGDDKIVDTASTPGGDTAKRASFEDRIDAAFAAMDDGSFRFRSATITSGDGTELMATLFEPVSDGGADDAGSVPRPAVVFVNSWALNAYQYIVPAAILAKRGYVVLSYATRGFGGSGGLVNVAGPDDMDDLSAVLDWLLANTAVDDDRIAMAGISYGAGISLRGLAQEPRIKTAVAMSGWANLTDSLYKDNTPRLAWGLLLLASGYFTGQMDPFIAQLFQNLLSNNDIADTLAWSAERSPATYLDAINASGKPIYMSNNLSDTLFNPNQMVDFYDQLTVPKRLDLKQGTHATAELAGLIGLPNFVWDNAYDWFDYWLLGEPTGIMERPPVTIEKKFSDERLELAEFPSNTAPGALDDIGIGGADAARFYLTPRLFTDGALSERPNQFRLTNSIRSGVDSVATTGIPLLSEALESHLNLPVLALLPAVGRLHGLSLWSSWLREELSILGRPQLSLRLSSSTDTAHVVVYLYDVNLVGVGTLITHGTASLHDIAPGRLQTLEVDLNAVAYDVPAGHRIAIVVDAFDVQYAGRMPFWTELSFHYEADGQMMFDLPLYHVPAVTE